MSSMDSWLAALALLLICEGLLPLLRPDRWRSMFRQLLALRDGQLRFFGLLAVALGAVILLLI